MDLALPHDHFAGLGDGPHLPWSVSSDSPGSPTACRLDTSGEEDLMSMSSPCLNLDNLSSSHNDSRDSVGLSDLSITLLCDSEEVLTPVNSNQVLSDVDLPAEGQKTGHPDACQFAGCSDSGCCSGRSGL